MTEILPDKQASNRITRKGGFLPFFAVLLAILACAAAGWLAYQGHQLQQQVHKQQIALAQLSMLDQQPAIQSLLKESNQQRENINSIRHEMQNALKSVVASIERAESLSKASRSDWMIAETLYLMRLASTRLHLVLDIDSAIAALQMADQRLADLQNPRYLPVRKALTKEITQLNAIARPDIDGTALKLQNIMDQLPKLPSALAPEVINIQDKPLENEQSYLLTIWNMFLIAVGYSNDGRISSTQQSREALYNLDQLIRLELEAARQALLRYDTNGYERRLKKSQAMLTKHYDQHNEQVIRISNELSFIAQYSPFPILPDIAGSLELLKQIQNQHIPANNVK